MSESPISPKLLKGAIIGLDLFNPLASLVIFQYNPENIRRTLTPNTAGGQASSSATAPADALRLTGPPTEMISADIEIDATDHLETGTFPETVLGIHPVLASLEMLVYPKTVEVIANEALASAGIIEVVPPEAPLTLFVWVSRGSCRCASRASRSPRRSSIPRSTRSARGCRCRCASSTIAIWG